jgi:enamine deaminase RidA (YjgF/YER057c/UK114 family)
MASVQHLNPTAGAKPYRDLFSTVSIIPPNTAVAYISTQWACDPNTGELFEGIADDYYKQAKIVQQNLVGILKELGAEMKDIVHRTVCYK